MDRPRDVSLTARDICAQSLRKLARRKLITCTVSVTSLHCALHAADLRRLYVHTVHVHESWVIFEASG